jgi:energy-coupling factor transport system permease protein
VKLNAIAWCVWGLAALAAAFIDRNPYLQLVLLMVLINVWLPNQRSGTRFWTLGAILALAPVVFSVVFSRFGHTVLFRLPAVPLIGGAWTLEAVLFGASTGTALLLVVVVFAILRTTVRSQDLIALLPAPLYGAGTAFALAVAFAPQTVRSLQAISEGRRLRGQRSGWRAAPALLVPLLLTTMERALQYAESLDARGFGSRRRSHYRPLKWHAPDFLVAFAALGCLLTLLTQPGASYNPYVDLRPVFPPAAGLLAVLALALPAVAAGISWRHDAPDLV